MAAKDYCIPKTAQDNGLSEEQVAVLVDLIEYARDKFGNDPNKVKAYVRRQINQKKLNNLYLKKQVSEC